MKRVFTAFLAVLMLTLCGCSTVILSNGTLELEANDVDHIVIVNGLTGKTFSVADRETINTIVSHINSYALGDPMDTWNGNQYNLNFVDSEGKDILYFAVNETKIIVENVGYSVDAQDLLQYVEGLECDTLTDNELIDSLLESDTLNKLNIIDDKGKISLDKIVNLPKSCPALFELISRPSAITSVGSYGVDKISTYLNSSNPELVEKAEEWIEVLKKLVPQAQQKLEDLIKNYENSKNNP